MRVLSFPVPESTPQYGKINYTLVIEWFAPDGKTVEEDERYMMDAEEFEALKTSVNQAGTDEERDIWRERANEKAS